MNFLIAALAWDLVTAVVTSAGAEFHTRVLGNEKLFSLILDLKPILSLFSPALLVIPWLVIVFSKRLL